VLVLDTSAFLSGIVSSINGEKYTVIDVVKELRSKQAADSISIEILTRKLKIYEPAKESLDIVRKYASETGDLKVLSHTDLKVLALAYELTEKFDVTIISDDYAIQNIASTMGVKYKNILSTGIKKVFTWKVYCPGCGKSFSAESKVKKCDVCGTILKRKISKVTSKKE